MCHVEYIFASGDASTHPCSKAFTLDIYSMLERHAGRRPAGRMKTHRAPGPTRGRSAQGPEDGRALGRSATHVDERLPEEVPKITRETDSHSRFDLKIKGAPETRARGAARGVGGPARWRRARRRSRRCARTIRPSSRSRCTSSGVPPSTRFSAVSSPIWSIDSSNESHGPWICRTLSIVLGGSVSTILKNQRNSQRMMPIVQPQWASSHGVSVSSVEIVLYTLLARDTTEKYTVRMLSAHFGQCFRLRRATPPEWTRVYLNSTHVYWDRIIYPVDTREDREVHGSYSLGPLQAVLPVNFSPIPSQTTSHVSNLVLLD
jgi:hypothetical protein